MTTIAAEIQSLSPTAIIEMFVLDATSMPGGVVHRFHAGTNKLTQPLVWQGVTYSPLPIEAEGFDLSGKGVLPRPKIRVANVNGMFSAEVMAFDDLVGCKVTRKRTFARYLDAANFPPLRNLATTTDYTASTWSNIFSANASITTGVADPFGGNTAVRLRVGDGVSGHLAAGNAALRLTSQGISVAAGETCYFSFYCRAVSLPASIANMDASDGNPQTNYKSQLVQNQWVRVVASRVATAARTINFLDLWSDNAQACILEFAGVQFEKGALTDYQPVGIYWTANQEADPNQHFPDDLWYVERKVSENRYIIEWELASAFDLQGVMLPGRQIIQNSCAWKYRSAECGYTGTNYFDANDVATTLAGDFCAKRLSSCRARFRNNTLPFGGFPGVVRYG